MPHGTCSPVATTCGRVKSKPLAIFAPAAYGLSTANSTNATATTSWGNRAPEHHELLAADRTHRRHASDTRATTPRSQAA